MNIENPQKFSTHMIRDLGFWISLWDKLIDESQREWCDEWVLDLWWLCCASLMEDLLNRALLHPAAKTSASFYRWGNAIYYTGFCYCGIEGSGRANCHWLCSDCSFARSVDNSSILAKDTYSCYCNYAIVATYSCFNFLSAVALSFHSFLSISYNTSTLLLVQSIPCCILDRTPSILSKASAIWSCNSRTTC